jgi:hypothetical protein
MQPIELIRPSIFTKFTEVAAAQSSRIGGFSQGAYAGMNLGKSTEDDAATVQANLAQFKDYLGFQEIALSHQVHGTEILIVERPGIYQGYDALITQKRELLIGVSIADCCPILLYDPEKKVVAAVHAGWKGTVGSLVSKTLLVMQSQFGVQGKDCYAYIGTCISKDHFEVGAEVAAQFPSAFKHFEPSRGKYMIDLKAANAQQCLAANIPQAQIEYSPYCTYESADRFFSHRKSGGITGRMLAVIGLH